MSSIIRVGKPILLLIAVSLSNGCSVDHKKTPLSAAKRDTSFEVTIHWYGDMDRPSTVIFLSRDRMEAIEQNMFFEYVEITHSEYTDFISILEKSDFDFSESQDRGSADQSQYVILVITSKSKLFADLGMGNDAISLFEKLRDCLPLKKRGGINSMIDRLRSIRDKEKAINDARVA